MGGSGKESSSGKKNAITYTLQVVDEHFTNIVEMTGSCPDCAFEGSKEKERDLDSMLSGRNDKFREQETRVVD